MNIMSNWFVKNLGEAMFAEDHLDLIKSIFLLEYKKVNCPNEMAVFLRHETEGRLHCEVKVFFSPAATVVANILDAMPCIKPSLDGLDLLAGSDKSWAVLFSRNAF